MRIACYHRVSTTDQHPQGARDELTSHATRLGASTVDLIEETGSGANNDREGLQKLLEGCRRGRWDAVLVYKLDRFGRSSLDVLTNIRALEAAGVRFIVTSQGLDIRPNGDAVSRLTLTVLAAVAEFERELIRERTRVGMRRAKAAGKHVGRPRKRGAVITTA